MAKFKVKKAKSIDWDFNSLDQKDKEEPRALWQAY